MAHSNTVYNVEMWKWDHNNIIETLDERETITELAVVDYVSMPAHGSCKLIPIHFSIQETVDIIDIESAWLERRL